MSNNVSTNCWSSYQFSDTSLEILVNGKPIKTYYKNLKTFVEGKKDSEFTIKIRNNNYYRILAVVSVDGISVMDGSPANENSRGYIIPARSFYEIEGWRTSLDEVSKFVFADKDKAYSVESVGSDENCGIIGVMVYNEKQNFIPLLDLFPKYNEVKPNPWITPWKVSPDITNPYVYEPHIYFSSNVVTTANSLLHENKMKSMTQSFACMDSVEAKTPVFDLGTGHGDFVESKVVEESFERDGLLETKLIYYASRKSLEKIGIELKKEAKIEKKQYPKAFNGFCNIKR